MHAFSLNLVQDAKNTKGATMGCDVSLAIEGNKIIEDHMVVGMQDAYAATGGADLSEGLYSTVLSVACNEIDGSPLVINTDLTEPVGVDNFRVLLSTIHLDIAARRPDKASMEVLGPQDVVYISEQP